MAVGYNPNANPIGGFKQSGSLYVNQPIDNSSGGQSDNFVLLLTTRGRLDKVSGTFDLLQGQFNNDKRYTWTCRYQLAITWNPGDIWKIGANSYRIIDGEKVEQTPRYYSFILNKQ